MSLYLRLTTITALLCTVLLGCTDKHSAELPSAASTTTSVTQSTTTVVTTDTTATTATAVAEPIASESDPVTTTATRTTTARTTVPTDSPSSTTVTTRTTVAPSSRPVTTTTTRTIVTSSVRPVTTTTTRTIVAVTTAETTATAPTTAPVSSTEDFEAEVLRLTNLERTAQGLSPLTEGSTAAYRAADTRAVEIGKQFSHTRPDGSSCFTALDEVGVTYRSAGENIAKGHRTPAQVVESWMNSDGHRSNILNANFTHLAVGYTDGGWVQLFYTPL